MGAVAAGASGTSAACCCGNGDPVSFAETFGNRSVGVGTSAVFALNRRVGLAEASHFFKFVIAVSADIFVNRHDECSFLNMIILTAGIIRRVEVTDPCTLSLPVWIW